MQTMWYDEQYITNSLTSPDGALRLEQYVDQEERQPARDYLRLVRTANGEEIFRLWDAKWVGEVDFSVGGELRLTLDYESRHAPVLIDVEGQTFRLHPHDFAQPLNELVAQLQEQYGASVGSPAQPSSRGRTGSSGRAGMWLTLSRLFMFVASLFFVVIGLWLLFFNGGMERE